MNYVSCLSRTKRLPDNRFNDSLKLQWYTDILCVYINNRESSIRFAASEVVRRHTWMRPDNFQFDYWTSSFNIRFDDIWCNYYFRDSSVFLVQRYRRINIMLFYLEETMNQEIERISLFEYNRFLSHCQLSS